MTRVGDAAVREKRSLVLLAVGMTWLPVVANFVPWTYYIARRTIQGTHFTVDGWTLANPFLTVIMIPTGLALAACRRSGLAAVFLVIPAGGWTLHEVFMQHLFLLQEPNPKLVGIQILSASTLLLVGAYAAWRTIRR